MSSNKIYWKSVEQLDQESEVVQKLEQNEFIEKIPVDEFLGDEEILGESRTNRRDFLKYVGFSTAAASLAACEGPVIKSVPYVVQPEQIRPGIANYYATSIADGFDFASVLIKTREGRPIKVENNPDAPTLGCANARVNASVLSLYDIKRLQGPKVNTEDVPWSDLYKQVTSKLKALAATNIPVVLLTQTFASPTTNKIIEGFKREYPNVSHVIYDAISSSAALAAFENVYGVRALADYDFSKAETIVSVAADILGDWQGGGYDSSYTKGRVPVKRDGPSKMSHHIQFESNMTLSGANADKRVPSTPVTQKKSNCSNLCSINQHIIKV
jgi:molybdopterin-containing oxidoreductase family iron-sulfur binding subunit